MRAFPIRPDIQTATSSAYDGDGFLSVGVDGDGADTNLPAVEAMPPLGLFARPLDPGTDGAGSPLPGQSCSLLRLVGDNDDQAIALTDPRVVPLLPQLGKGGVCVYEPTNEPTDLARLVLNDDGSHRILVHAAQGKRITVEVAGGPSVVIDGGTTPPSVTVTAGSTTLVVDDTGVQAGGPGGQPIALANPAFLAWLATVGAATSAGPPPVFAATKATAK